MRSETNGKHSILGVYSGDVLAQELAGNLRTAVYVEATSRELGVLDAILTVYFNKEPVLRGEAKFNFLNTSVPAVFAIPTFPIVLTKEGVIRVDIECNGVTRTALSKSVRKADLGAVAREREKSMKALTPPAPRRRRTRDS